MSGTRYTAAYVAECRRLFDAGFTVAEIRKRLVDRDGHCPAWTTLSIWVDDNYAERRRREQSAADQKYRAHKRDRWLGMYRTKHSRLDRMRDLDEKARLSMSAISRLMELDFGEKVTVAEVKAFVEDGRVPERYAA